MFRWCAHQCSLGWPIGRGVVRLRNTKKSGPNPSHTNPSLIPRWQEQGEHSRIEEDRQLGKVYLDLGGLGAIFPTRVHFCVIPRSTSTPAHQAGRRQRRKEQWGGMMATTPERDAGPSGLAGWAKWAQQVGTRKEVYPDLMEVYPDLLKTKRPSTLPATEVLLRSCAMFLKLEY